MIDFRNLLWAYRYRIFFKMAPETILSYTVPEGGCVNVRVIQRVATGAPPLEIVRELWGDALPGMERIEDIPARDAVVELEIIFRRYLYREATEMLTGYPLHLGTALAYILLLEAEVDDLIALMEGRINGWSVNRIRSNLIGVAKGGVAAIPGGFGTGKTVIQHALAQWSDADIIIYIGCGERGNEMTEVLEEFPELNDPWSGHPLMERTLLIANTSDMPVSARESSIYTGVTMAEYYRDQGYDVALMADSTSRWAQALREISGRLGEMPVEEGYPAYLAARLSAFYERAGRIKTLGAREGSVTLIGAVSPPGGDFSEPVTRHTQRFTRTWWALDRDLAHNRHFPAIDWISSYSLHIDPISEWWKSETADDWNDLRRKAMAVLHEESGLQQLVQLVGPDALSEDQQWTLTGARLLREGFLQQNALHPVDAYAVPEKQVKLLRCFVRIHRLGSDLIDRGVSLDRIRNALDIGGLIRLLNEFSNEDLEKLDDRVDVNGAALNPAARNYPRSHIETGISAIDGMNTLVRGQKLPIFSGNGLPHNDIAAQIARQARVGGEEDFAIIFAAMGVSHDTAEGFRRSLEESGAIHQAALFLNLADDPAVERIITPRAALSLAEFLAFRHEMHILVLLTDMTNYGEALREISNRRGEVPTRKGFPGYLYSDLAQLYERCGRVQGGDGSITIMPILTMPNDDITHPIPDLTGYITEGQIVLSWDLNRKGIYPPINVLPSLSRLMKDGIGEGETRDDHQDLSNQLYAAYSEVQNAREMARIIGEDDLPERDQNYLRFGEAFENRFLTQGRSEARDLTETLDLGWEVLSLLPGEELNRVSEADIEAHYTGDREGTGE
jgi:V/A-type H+/Na+-transporting ATPase subunit B